MAYGELAIAVLDMLALYDRLLDVMGWFARDTLDDVADLDDETKENLERIIHGRDGDGARLFVRVADRLELPGDRSQFVNNFKRLKAARDHVAHASAMNAMTRDGVPSIGIPYYQSRQARVGSLDGGRSSITLRLVRNRIRDARWMLQHVQWGEVHFGQFGGPVSFEDEAPTAPPPGSPRG